MISRRDLERLRAEWPLSLDVIEKDYVLGWLLAGIAQHPELSKTWIFKGGTSLRKCYYETFRFSEDLDFTVAAEGPDEPDDLVRIFEQIADWLQEECGIEFRIERHSFTRKKNRRGNATTQGKLEYQGPIERRSFPKVKLDITKDEILVNPPEIRRIEHNYGDSPLPGVGVLSYSLTELFGEKLRALAERCRPRDLYDVVHLHRHPDLAGQSKAVAYVLEHKCVHAGIEVPTLESIYSSPFRDEVEKEWANMLSHQLPAPLAPFSVFWDALEDVFAWLSGSHQIPRLPRAESGNLDRTWVAPKAISSWRSGFPLQLLRYAAANHLKVDIDYLAANGRSGPRRVEPYSLRRTAEGNRVLFVVNDIGELRSYRVDRIRGIKPSTVTFKPRFQIEL